MGFLYVSLGKVCLCNLIKSINYKALEIKSNLGRKSAILEEGNRIYIKFTILTVLNIQVISVKYIHIVV